MQQMISPPEPSLWQMVLEYADQIGIIGAAVAVLYGVWRWIRRVK